MKLNPYIMFPGNAEEALLFYKECFNGNLSMQRYGDTPMPSPAEYKDKIMHATFTFGESVLMASDAMPGKPVPGDSNIHIAIDFSDASNMERIFNQMAAGGQVTMPLQDTFWGARFGMLTDKFNIHWMFNHEVNQQQQAT